MNSKSNMGLKIGAQGKLMGSMFSNSEKYKVWGKIENNPIDQYDTIK